ncbi:MAG: tRNA-dihydrouridine synthase family protein, partial [Proteobacteria bacterium]|nr:tRNA-dihydrouridine synthase family protein [Pseudomonadota bacterium]
MQNYIKPIQLGSLKLQSNIVQGPLAGYSCAPFRVLAWRYGQPGFCTTEMISANDLVHRREKPKRFLYRDPEEKILSYQLSGNDPLMLAKATEIVTKEGADIIDLNCGCPVNKIRRKNCGSKLLTTPEQLYQLIRAIKQNTDAVVSIKIRVASPVHDHDEALIIDAATKAGVDFITVHGRHWTERYDKLCQIEAIARIVKMTNLPIFANGDVADIDSLNHIFEKT